MSVERKAGPIPVTQLGDASLWALQTTMLWTCPRLALRVFHTRLGLSFIDALGAMDNPSAQHLAANLIDHAVRSRDGYVARDILKHSGCQASLTTSQEADLTNSLTQTQPTLEQARSNSSE